MKGEGKRIIVAPLNWGLGHASRCIPLVKLLLEQGFEPVLAGDGSSLELLSSEFPELRKHELPSYDIQYARTRWLFKLKLLSLAQTVQKAISKEHRRIQEILNEENASGIISDNRFGAWSDEVPSVYLTHQVWIKAGLLSKAASRWNRQVISRFDHCWICDYQGEDSLAGELSSGVETLNHLEWIGPLSRFSHAKPSEKEIDICIVLSGPEPSRSQFEKKVLEVIKGTDKKVVLVQGIVEEFQIFQKEENITRYNYMLADELESTIRSSKLVISRSGYSTIMDLYALGSNALLIPTPGQTEQEYLADQIKQKELFSSVRQRDFCMESIEDAMERPYAKKKKTSERADFSTLFDVFLQGN